jgi:hypothetical protein
VGLELRGSRSEPGHRRGGLVHRSSAPATRARLTLVD